MIWVFLLLEYGVKMQKQSIQRKIIETKGSYYINIPKQVATNLQLKKGEQVAIYPNSNGFLVGLLTVYSIGYEKRTIEELLSILKQHKITQVIDVRERAFSRVPAYRKAKLEKTIIVCNPPYADAPELQIMPTEYQHEPKIGLEAGTDGLFFVTKILREAIQYLTHDGTLIVEVGVSQTSLIEQYPNVPFLWLEFQQGGEGVFLLTAEQLRDYAEFF